MSIRIDSLDYSSMTDKQLKEEEEANYFAVALLMPEDLFMRAVEKGMTTEQLAKYFGSSIPAVQYRFKTIYGREA